MKWFIAIAMLLVTSAMYASAQKLDVKILNRQDREASYDYAAVYNNVAVGKTFKVHGATFTLQIPDGRLVVVNCESKLPNAWLAPQEIGEAVVCLSQTAFRQSSKATRQS
jgi:hypothetical protein